MSAKTSKPYRMVISGVGGQGLMLIARILGEACNNANIPFTSLEDHGMSQRGGSISLKLQFGENFGLDFLPGKADSIIAMEPMEATRHIHALKPKGILIVDTTPIEPLTISMNKENQYPSINDLLKPFDRLDTQVISLKAREEADKLGNAKVANIILLGAALATKTLPLDIKQIEEVLKEILTTKILDINLKALNKGFDLGRSDL